MMRKFFDVKWVGACALACMFWWMTGGCTADREEPIEICDTLQAGYNAKVKPILQTYCAISTCHEAATPAYGDFNLYSDVKARVDAGVFQQKVLISKEMPPSGNLTAEELQIFRCWIENGALNN